MVLVEDLIRDVPPITRVLCGSSILIHFLVYLGTLTPYDVYFNMKLIISQYQVWRAFTSLFYFGEGAVITFFSLLLLFRCSKRLEEHTFRGRIADYLFFLLIGVIVMSTIGTFMGFTTLSKSFLTMLLYLWSRYNKNVVLLIFGVLPMKAPYVTWFFVLFDIILGHSIAADLLGIAIAHIFYFFNDIYPKIPYSKGVYLLKAPKFFADFVNKLNIAPANAAFQDFAYDDEPEAGNGNGFM